MQKTTTISIDVRTNKPIGILGITTFEATFSNIDNNLSLSNLIASVMNNSGDFQITDEIVSTYFGIKGYDKEKEKFDKFSSGSTDGVYYLFFHCGSNYRDKCKYIITKLFGFKSYERLIR